MNSRYFNLYPNGHILSPVALSTGYFKVTLCCDGRRKDMLVHRLVALTYHGEPGPGQEVNHKDFDKSNNASSNLEWTSRGENSQHAVLGGRKYIPPLHKPECMAHGEGHGMAKLTLRKVELISRLLGNGYTGPYLAKRFGVSNSTIYRIKDGSAWRRR